MGRRPACSLALVLALACSSEKDAASIHPNADGKSPSEDAHDDTNPGGELPRSDDDVPSDDDDTADDPLANPDSDSPTVGGLDDDGLDDDAVGPVDPADGSTDDDTFRDNSGGTSGTGVGGDEGNTGGSGTMSAGPDGGAAGSSQSACSCDADVNGDGLTSFFAEDNAAVSHCLGQGALDPVRDLPGRHACGGGHRLQRTHQRVR